MASDPRLLSSQFPLASRYNPDWLIANSMGSNTLWLTEWLASEMQLQSGARVLDLGCGRAVSSIFLAREFGVQVWATDLWVTASDNARRIQDVELQDQIFPLHADAHALPFAGGFFDAIVVIDSFSYYGTDDLYLNYLANFVKPGGLIGIAGAGLSHEVESAPEHLREIWTQDFWCLHSADWWRRHWERTGIVDIEVADSMPDAWKMWLEWQQTAHPENRGEIDAVQADQGRTLDYVRAIGRRRQDAQLEDYCWPDTLRSFPPHYDQRNLLRDT